MSEKEKVIEKHILRYLFTHDEFQFKYDNPSFNLYQTIGKSIEKELDISILGVDDFKRVYEDLLDKKMIEQKYDKASGGFKNGEISLNITSDVREYVLQEGYIETKEIINYIDIKYHQTIKVFMTQFKRIENLESDLEKQKEELLSKIGEQERKIRDFNNNIISIMAILIAAFAIIGFNIGGVKFIVGNNEVSKPWEYAGSIALLNLSIVFSLYFLFYLLNKIINPNSLVNSGQAISEAKEPSNKKRFAIFSNKIVISLSIFVVILILLCFIIA